MSKTSIPVKPKITYDELLGRIIEYRRKQLGLVQEPLAKALGITQSAYSRLEKGQSALSVSQLRRIAPYVRATPAQLLDETEQYTALFQRQGGEVTAKKEESSGAGLLVALGLLTAILASGKK